MEQSIPAHMHAAPRSAEQVNAILEELAHLYPTARYDLNFSTPLELFVATQLAAQCTDARVNAVTQTLFQKYRSAEDYANASLEEFEQDIKAITFFRNKAKNIRAACQVLVQRHQGEVPQSMAEMVMLPGVARKTANVILGNAFGISDGIIIDTHVGRLARRFGWSQSEDPVKVEQDMMKLIPRTGWLNVAHRMIYHGRAVCPARKPHCAQCTLAQYCPAAFTEKP
ncbi:MAG TPA: endonuclease III [Ktedonobacteraceae bacterium]|nr:endonuclease III [Ktedonobacteraceae bacterium]